MPRTGSVVASIELQTDIVWSSRVAQVEGIFDLTAEKCQHVKRHIELPLYEREWNIGLIVGPSGAGKSTAAQALFGESLITGFDWDANRAIVDGFPESLGIKEITGLLSSVGFSSAPHWLRPYGTLSTGEQFRVTLARALAEAPEFAVVDEFTSVVDRTVAQIGSAAVAKAVRRSGKKLVAVSCHYDIIDWLQPDWIYQPHEDSFAWRALQRHPEIRVTVQRVHRSAWALFRRFHYLDSSLNSSAACYLGSVEGRPAAFVAVISVFGRLGRDKRARRRGTRGVCLPDFQGVGIGNRMIDYVGSLHKALGIRYLSTTSHPALIKSRAKSPIWNMNSAPRLLKPDSGRSLRSGLRSSQIVHATGRLTASFEYVGPPGTMDDARGLLSRSA